MAPIERNASAERSLYFSDRFAFVPEFLGNQIESGLVALGDVFVSFRGLDQHSGVQLRDAY